MPSSITLPTRDSLGNYPPAIADSLITNLTAIAADQVVSGSFRARGAVFTNHSTTAFTVATNTDGVTYVAGDVVLFTNQTTTAENGPWVVGTVATTAPLTRPTWWATGATIPNGVVIEVSEGTIFNNSSWKATCTGAKVVGTTNHDPLFYPRVVKGTLTLASGTKTLGATEGLFLLSTTTSPVTGGFNTAGGTVTSTVGWRAAVASRTAGKSGTAAVIIIAIVAAGTIDSANNSTFDYCITNW
jgi:hypothetical protein